MGMDGRCIGAYDIDRNINIRLLNAGGRKQPPEFPYRVGDKIKAKYYNLDCSKIKSPHTEDVCLISHEYCRSYSMEALEKSIKSKDLVVQGGLIDCFNGSLKSEKLDTEDGRRGSLCVMPGESLGHSVCFWEADRDLKLSFNSYRKLSYNCDTDGRTVKIPFIGDHVPEEEISKGKIVRLSLARWWRPNEKHHWRCQPQLSGCYH